MKKSKKILSLLLSLVMMLSVVSIPAMAEDVPAATTLSPSGDVYIGYSSNASVENSYKFVRIYKKTSSPAGWKYGSVGAFSYDISDVWNTLAQNDGYVVKSAKWKAYVKYAGTNATSCKFNFYMMDTQWTEATITKNTLPANVASYPVWHNAPDASYNSTITTSKQLQTYDLTSVLKKHMTENKNESNKNFFSFALDFTTNGQAECDIDANSATASSSTAAVLEVEYFLPADLSLESSTLPVQPKDDAVLTYNNYIKSATAKINDVDVDEQYITIADKTVTVDYPFAKNTNYTIEVTAIDENGDSDTFTGSFTTTYNTESVDVHLVSTNHTSGSSVSTSQAIGGGSWGNGVMIYGFTVPQKTDNGYIEKAEFSFWTRPESPMSVYEFVTDSAISDIRLADAKAIMTEDACITNNAEKITAKEYNGNTWGNYKANLSNYISRLQNNGKAGTTAYVAVASFSTTNPAAHNYTGNLPTALKATINAQPSIEVTDSSCNVRGSVIRALSVELPTVFDSELLLSNLVLREAATKEAANVSFKYDPASRKITLASAATLAENKVYELVINEGTADLYGNTVPAGGLILIGNISSGANTVATAPILVAASTEIADGTDFASLTPLSEVANAKAVAKVTNYRTTSTTVRIAAAAYDANGELLSIGINDQWIRQGSTFTIASPAISADGAATIKAFVWDYYDQVTPFAVSCTVGAAR